MCRKQSRPKKSLLLIHTNGLAHSLSSHVLTGRFTSVFRTESYLKSTAIAALLLALGACDVGHPPSSWVRLPPSGAGWKDQEFDRQSIYGRGEMFVTVRAIDGSFSQRLQISCAQSAYRIVWHYPPTAGATNEYPFGPAWLPITDPWEQALAREVCKKAS